MIKLLMAWNRHRPHTSLHLNLTNSTTVVHSEFFIGTRDNTTEYAVYTKTKLSVKQVTDAVEAWYGRLLVEVTYFGSVRIAGN